MSAVFLQVGQCGNQIGQAFWKKVGKDEDVQESHCFVTNDGTPRCVVVDSEPKVLKKIVKSASYREKSVISGKRGRGSNWAMGYYGLKNRGDDTLLEDALEAVRAEVERCDHFNGVVLFHSLSGGTGSGLGSRLVEALRDEFTMNQLMSCVFSPHASGEAPLQHFNSLLTLAAVQRNADCVVLTHNDDVLYRVQKRKGEERVSFSDLNNAIANHLCGIFLPTDSLKTKTSYSLGMEPWEMSRSICPMPSLKFVQTAQCSKSQQTWEGICSQLSVTLKKHDRMGQPFSSLGNVVVARGDSTGGFHLHTKALEAKILQAYNCVSWNPFPIDFWSARLNSCGSRSSATLTIAANSSSVVDYLESVLQRSKVMYDSGAYLHWYWRHGACKEQFEAAFEEVQMVVDNYKEAVK